MTTKKTGTEVATIEEQIRKDLETLNQRVTPPSSTKISTEGSRFTLPGGEPKPGPISVVILNYTWVLSKYKGAYQKGKPQAPICFAVGDFAPDGGQLSPHEESPEKQNDVCKTCKHNQWGTGPNGRGRACKHTRRLVVVAADADKDTQPLTLYVSPTALRNFDAYVTDLAREQLSPVQVITSIDFDPNESYPKLIFRKEAKHGDLALMWDLKNKWDSELTYGLQGLVRSGDGD